MDNFNLVTNPRLKATLDTFEQFAYAQVASLTVVHPCESFARSANFESWAQVVEAIETGKVVVGRLDAVSSLSCKSIVGLQAFSQAVLDAGYHTKCDDFGSLALSKKPFV